jgi:hypothetical protein
LDRKPAKLSFILLDLTCILENTVKKLKNVKKKTNITLQQKVCFNLALTLHYVSKKTLQQHNLTCLALLNVLSLKTSFGHWTIFENPAVSNSIG